MNMNYDIDNFVKLFVQARWQERFKHEFNKKPHDLMHRCITGWENIFNKDVLHTKSPTKIKNETMMIIDWGDMITEMEWTKFLAEYPKSHSGFIAISKTGNLGFLETHEAHPKDSRHYYIYKT